MDPKIWFITGCSRGFSHAFTCAALEAGDLVVMTARRPEQLTPLVEKYGPKVYPVELDVTASLASESAIQRATERFGRIAVVVNNAGYANVAPFDTATVEGFRRQNASDPGAACRLPSLSAS